MGSATIILAICVLLQVSTGTSAMVSRSQWGARAAKSSTYMGNSAGRVFIHHTDTSECSSLSSCGRLLRAIQNYHMDRKRWDDIGYNFLVGQDGRVYEGRGWNKVGAHTRGYNTGSYGISFIGTFTSKVPNLRSINAAKDLIADGVRWGKISRNYKLYGHRQAGSTTCPGNSLYRNIKAWNHYSSRL